MKNSIHMDSENKASSPEREFYLRHYGGKVAAAGHLNASPNSEYLEDGGRYSLAVDRLKKSARDGDSLAELGCGAGEMLLMMSKLAKFSTVSGLDIAFEKPQHIENVNFYCSNLNETWPFEDASIDHLVAMMIFEHLFDPFHSFKEISRVLKPEGVAYVNLPLVTSIRNRIRFVQGKLPETSVPVSRWFEDSEWDGNHLHYFSLPMIRRLAIQMNLCVDEVKGVGRFHRLKTAFPDLLASEVTFSLRKAL